MCQSLMTGIRMHDGTVLYCKDIEIEDGLWTLRNARSPNLAQRIEEFKLHEDAIEVYFHVLKGGLNEIPES